MLVCLENIVTEVDESINGAALHRIRSKATAGKFSVMVARLQKVYSIFAHLVHNAMFARQSPRPGSCSQIL